MELVSIAIGVGSAKAGAAIGAGIGSAIPIVGTAGGAVIGGALGFVGSVAGSIAFDVIYDNKNKIISDVKKKAKKAGDAVKGFFGGLSTAFG